MLKPIIVLVTFVKLSAATLVGSCHKCFASNNVACLDETHFVTCFQGSPTPTITKCPDNRVCTDDVLICRYSIENYKPVCYHSDYCGECEVTNGVFTCLDETTYGYCYGGKTPVENTFRSCPQGYVCNYNSTEICVPKATHEPSCIKTTSTTTEIDTATTGSIIESTTLSTANATVVTHRPTTAPGTVPTTQATTTSSTPRPRSADVICNEIRSTGYFQSDDLTCRQFVYCYILSGEYLGWFFYCKNYFNANTQSCQRERPADCLVSDF